MASEKPVLVISVDKSEAPFRLRMLILQDLLGPQGYRFDFVPRSHDRDERKKLVATADRYHAVIVQRKLLDPPHARLLRKKARRIYYDLDDAVMVQRRRIGWISRWLKHRRLLATARIIDHVVAGNEYLADTFRKLGCTATVLPTVVNPADYQVKNHAFTATPTLVWIGSHSTLPYLWESMPAIESAARRMPGLRLITIANDTVRSDVVAVEHVPWSLEAEAAALIRGDIGIAPTPMDHWTIGKSGFKIIQYMASGLPTVASPVGANADLIADGVTGLHAQNAQQWADAIVQLAGDVEIRRRMGMAARTAVQQQYTLDRAKQVWGRLLEA